MTRKYLIDDRPVSWRELIDEAAAIDDEYARDPLKQTSVAARILRNAGHEVSDFKTAADCINDVREDLRALTDN